MTQRSIYKQIVDFIEGGNDFAIALVIRADGSTPQKPGARAIIDGAGKIWGTLGGGFAEAEAQRRAVEICKSKKAIVLDVALEGSSAEGSDPICGGAMRILIDPCAAKDKSAYAEAADAIEKREQGVLITSVSTDEKVIVKWQTENTLSSFDDFPGADEISICLKREMPRHFVEETSGVVFIEPVIPRPALLIAGGGHIGQALAHQGNRLGFDVTVIDDRQEFANPERFHEGTTTICGDIPNLMADFPIDSNTYIVLVTHAHIHDAAALEACIHAPAAYIGMIGSKRKVSMLRESFIESGIAAESEFDRVFTPIGFDIGAITVEEIATCIAAQLVAVRRRGSTKAIPENMEQS